MLLLTTAPAPAVAQETPPPTPVPPVGSPSPYPSSLATPADAARPPALTAASAALFDLGSGRLLLERRAHERRPIASTTKVMTAMIVLERSRPAEVVTVGPSAAAQRGAVLGLRAGERIAVRDLLYALLLQSANDAAVALAEHVAATVERFVGVMNRRAAALGLEDTRFASPNGLDDSGYSTAADLAVITAHALREPLLARIVGTRFRVIPDPDGDPRRIQNRNALLWLYPGALGVKTGFTSAAGFCLIAAAERDGTRLGSVVLGAPGGAFSDAAALLNHGFEAFPERPVVTAGQRFAPIAVGGRRVPVEAARTLRAILIEGQEVIVRVRPVGGLRLPIRAGDEVGTATVTARGQPVGSVPVVATEDVGMGSAPAPPLPPPWWLRVAKGLGAVLAAFLLDGI